MIKKLNPEPARTDLTDRECTKIMGGVIGGLMEMSDLKTVRAAVQWWADLSEEHWHNMFNTTSPDLAGAFNAYMAKDDEKKD